MNDRTDRPKGLARLFEIDAIVAEVVISGIIGSIIAAQLQGNLLLLRIFVVVTLIVAVAYAIFLAAYHTRRGNGGHA